MTLLHGLGLLGIGLVVTIIFYVIWCKAMASEETYKSKDH